VAGCTRGYPDDEPPRRLRVQVEQYCSVKFPTFSGWLDYVYERPDWRRRARERQRRHPRRSPNFRFPDRAREREAREQGQSSLISPSARRPLFGLADSAASRFDLPFVLDDLSLQFVRARNGRLKLLATMTDRKCGGSLESGRVDRGATLRSLWKGFAVEPTGLGKQQTNERRLGRRGSPPSAANSRGCPVSCGTRRFPGRPTAPSDASLEMLGQRPPSDCPLVSRLADRYGGVEDFARAKWIPRQLDPPESALGVKRASTHQLCVAQASPISTP